MTNLEKLKKLETNVLNASAQLSAALGKLSSVASEIYGEEVKADLCGGGEIEYRTVNSKGYIDDFVTLRLEDIASHRKPCGI